MSACRAAVSLSDIVKLLDEKDLSEKQICKRLTLSQLQWLKARRDLRALGVIATVGKGKNKKYTLLRKDNKNE